MNPQGGAAEIERAMEEEKLKIVGAKPTCFDTLPFQLYRLSKWAVLGLPSLPSTLYSAYQKERERKAAAERAEREAEEEAARREEEKREKKEQRKQRKRVDRYVDRTGEVGNSDSDSGPPPLNGTAAGSAFAQPANALQVWTDADLAKLARLMKKYPAGTPERWERIAEVMERLPWEITKMAKRVKDVAYQVHIQARTCVLVLSHIAGMHMSFTYRNVIDRPRPSMYRPRIHIVLQFFNCFRCQSRKARRALRG